jgi:hypothetical protein
MSSLLPGLAPGPTWRSPDAGSGRRHDVPARLILRLEVQPDISVDQGAAEWLASRLPAANDTPRQIQDSLDNALQRFSITRSWPTPRPQSRPQGHVARRPNPFGARSSYSGMGNKAAPPEEEVLLAVALGAPGKATERRMLPDRRSGVDRRKTDHHLSDERRSGHERRQSMRRAIDREEGPTLLQKARSRLTRRVR